MREEVLDAQALVGDSKRGRVFVLGALWIGAPGDFNVVDQAIVELLLARGGVIGIGQANLELDLVGVRAGLKVIGRLRRKARTGHEALEQGKRLDDG